MTHPGPPLDSADSNAEGGLVLEEVQPESKRPMAATAWGAGLRGEVVVDPLP